MFNIWFSEKKHWISYLELSKDCMSKNHRLLSFFFVFAICINSKGQKPDLLLTRWANQSPIEKIYLHLDRNDYMAGETIWFKVYMSSEFLPDTISTSVFIELLDESSKIISRKVFPIILGVSKGQIELSDSLPAGRYFIRAYSLTMLNYESDYLYKHEIFVFGKNKRTAVLPKQNEKMIRLEFFPEAGNLISNFFNSIAFKATDENGFPVNVKGVVKNSKDENITSFSSDHDGMGRFEISPAENEKYYAIIEDDPGGKKYNLPEPATKGIVFSITDDPRGKRFEILQKKDDPLFQAAYMIGQMQHHVVFRQDFSQNVERIKGVIQTSNLSSGIVQITVFNKDNIPLAERIAFINNKEFIQNAELKFDTINFSNRGKNHFALAMKDTVAGSFSVSITDPDYDLAPARSENIFSTLLLTSDIKGYVHDPAYYFSSENDSVTKALDLVMMTNGWRRFKWSQLIKDSLPAKHYEDPAFITMKGNAKIMYTKKNFADKTIMLFISSPDSSASLQMAQTDKQGNFKLDSLVFFDYSLILFSDIRGKKSQLLDIKLRPDSLMMVYPLGGIDLNQFAFKVNNDSLNNITGTKFLNDYDAIQSAKGLMLPGVVVKARKKSHIQELEDRYVSGLFSSGFTEKTIDLTQSKDPLWARNIFEYLRGRVPGLQVVENGPDYMIYYRQSGSLFLGQLPMDIYLDEILTDANFISSIPVSDIALVKVFSSFIGGIGNSSGGALAIYTKKGPDLYDRDPIEGNKARYHGYSVIKEFYKPDYTVDTSAKKTFDHRITLYWNPDIYVTGTNVQVPLVFFNNDRTRRFKIVVEGMTIQGKMVSIEKIIEADTPKRSF